MIYSKKAFQFGMLLFYAVIFIGDVAHAQIDTEIQGVVVQHASTTYPSSFYNAENELTAEQAMMIPKPLVDRLLDLFIIILIPVLFFSILYIIVKKITNRFRRNYK